MTMGGRGVQRRETGPRRVLFPSAPPPQLGTTQPFQLSIAMGVSIRCKAMQIVLQWYLGVVTCLAKMVHIVEPSHSSSEEAPGVEMLQIQHVPNGPATNSFPKV